MAWNGITREKHNRESERPDAQADGWAAGVQEGVRSSLPGGFGLEIPASGFPPVPCAFG